MVAVDTLWWGWQRQWVWDGGWMMPPPRRGDGGLPTPTTMTSQQSDSRRGRGDPGDDDDGRAMVVVLNNTNSRCDIKACIMIEPPPGKARLLFNGGGLDEKVIAIIVGAS